MNIIVLRDECKQMGKEITTELEPAELTKKIAKIIVKNKILDDDAFEIAEQAYQEGRDEVTQIASN